MAITKVTIFDRTGDTPRQGAINHVAEANHEGEAVHALAFLSGLIPPYTTPRDVSGNNFDGNHYDKDDSMRYNTRYDYFRGLVFGHA